MQSTETGKPIFFNLDCYLALIEMFIQSDEVEKALWLMDNPPAYYQDHPLERLLKMKEELHRQLWTPVQYAGIYDGSKISRDFWPLRAQMVEKIVLENPGCHVMELADGGGWLESGLRDRKLTFTYSALSLDRKDKLITRELGKKIFVAFELIEHLHNPWEIYQNYLKFNQAADYVLISTPLYSWAGGCAEDWRARPLGHLRTYGPSGLHKTVSEMFQGFEWVCNTDNTIVLTGRRNGL